MILRQCFSLAGSRRRRGLVDMMGLLGAMGSVQGDRTKACKMGFATRIPKIIDFSHPSERIQSPRNRRVFLVTPGKRFLAIPPRTILKAQLLLNREVTRTIPFGGVVQRTHPFQISGYVDFSDP